MVGLWLWLACDVPYRVPKVPVDAGELYTPEQAWTKVRRDLVRAKACFANEGPYCVADPAFVDAVIQTDLNEHFHGRMPTNERWCHEVTERARGAWNAAMRERKVAEVQALVAANWEQPKVEKHGARADVFLLVPPGELSDGKTDWRVDTPLEDRGQLASVELARQLERHRAAHPKMPVVRLLLKIPIQRGAWFQAWDVRHLLEHDVVVVADPEDAHGVWVTGPLNGDFGPYLRGEASLHTDDLRRCGAPAKLTEPPDCSRSPRAPDRSRRRPPKQAPGPRAGWDEGVEAGG